jgi:hypothetical protein
MFNFIKKIFKKNTIVDEFEKDLNELIETENQEIINKFARKYEINSTDKNEILTIIHYLMKERLIRNSMDC